MKRAILLLLAGVIAAGITVLMFFPAAWVAVAVEKQTGGRLTLGDPQGTLWRGSAFVGGAASGNDPVAPLMPGRFAWTLSPAILLGKVDVRLENPSALSQPVEVTGTFHEWQVSPSAIDVPPDRLSALGAPLNTMQLSGQMKLSWMPLQLTRDGNMVNINGTMKLAMNDIGSRLSAVKPLGAYELTMDWQGKQASVDLKTVRGPMLLNGTGALSNGHFQFSGTAEAEPGQEEKLGNLLNLLGQRRRVGNRTIIALEFRS